MRAHEFDLSRFGELAALESIDGTILAVTAGLAELFGYTADELVGVSGWDLTPEANGERRARVRGTLETAGALTDVETVRRRDGTLLRVAYMAQMVDDETFVVTCEPVPPDGFTTSTADELKRAQLEHDARAAIGAPLGRWLTTAQAVAYAGVSESTLDRAVRDGKLPRGGTPHRRLFHTAQLDRWLAGGGGVLLALALALGLGCAAGVDLACDVLEPFV